MANTIVIAIISFALVLVVAASGCLTPQSNTGGNTQSNTGSNPQPPGQGQPSQGSSILGETFQNNNPGIQPPPAPA